jgi:glycosyltransferase involved in cell wall biosynthesis
VIATQVGGIPEMINPNNGILVPPASIGRLADAIQDMIRTYNKYNPSEISTKAKAKYSYAAVAEKLNVIYKTIC